MSRSDVWTRRLASAWLFWPACLSGLALLGLGLLGPEAERRLGVEAQCAAMQAEVDALRDVRDELAAKEHALQSDPEYIERVVRGNLRLTKPGEIALPQPLPLAPPKKPEPPAASPLLPPIMESLAKYASPWVRLAVMVSGAALLGAAMVLSLPGRQPRP